MGVAVRADRRRSGRVQRRRDRGCAVRRRASAPCSTRQPDPAYGPPRNAPERKQARPPVAPNVDASVEEAADPRRVAVGEDHHRSDAGLGDGIGDRLCARDVERERLLEHERLARACGAHREVRLHVRRHRDRDRVARVEQRVERRERRHAVLGRQRLRGGLGARPHPGELRLRSGGEHRRVHRRRPRPRPRQPDPQPLTHRTPRQRVTASVDRSADPSAWSGQLGRLCIRIWTDTQRMGVGGSWEGELGAGGAGAGVAGGDLDRRTLARRGRPTRPWPGRRSGRSRRRTSRASGGPGAWPASWPSSWRTSPIASDAPSGSAISTSTGRTALRSSAFLLTLVGSHPVFSTTSRTRHAPSPIGSAVNDRTSRCGDASWCATAHSLCGATSASMSDGGAFVQVRK